MQRREFLKATLAALAGISGLLVPRRTAVLHEPVQEAVRELCYTVGDKTVCIKVSRYNLIEMMPVCDNKGTPLYNRWHIDVDGSVENLDHDSLMALLTPRGHIHYTDGPNRRIILNCPKKNCAEKDRGGPFPMCLDIVKVNGHQSSVRYSIQSFV